MRLRTKEISPNGKMARFHALGMKKEGPRPRSAIELRVVILLLTFLTFAILNIPTIHMEIRRAIGEGILGHIVRKPPLPPLKLETISECEWHDSLARIPTARQLSLRRLQDTLSCENFREAFKRNHSKDAEIAYIPT